MLKKNNKGFSMIELIVVVAILIVATGVTAGSFRTAYNARSLQAAKTIDGLISQSKVNAMSGRRNALCIKYDDAKKCYLCSLYYLDAANHITGEPYEQREVGNSSLKIIVNNEELKENNFELRLIFNMDTGAVKTLAYSTNFEGGSSQTNMLGAHTTNKIATIQLQSYSNHTITLYKSTGQHTVS
ncbi:MAG: type II secretion system GspH family protein [Clostridia bacterium]|nr:type II secretion system GspH family protein [Clostridia bacterium]